MANNQINFDVNFNAKTSNLDQIKRSLQEIKNLSVSKLEVDLGKSFDNVKKVEQDLDAARKMADKLESALTKSFNPKLNTTNIAQFQKALEGEKITIDQVYQSFSKAGSAGQAAFRNLATQVLNTNLQIKTTTSALEKMATSFKNVAKYQINTAMFTTLTGQISSAVSYIEKLDDSLNRIRIVTGNSTAQMADFAVQANNAAKALGQTTVHYTDAALIFAQQGLDNNEIMERTEVTLKMMNVLGESASVASENLTAIMNNFDGVYESAEKYIDVISALGATTASSSDEIATGLSKFASVAETVGLSYEYATSAVATLVANTRQSADTVGTAFKTMLARIQGLNLGETLEDGVDLNKYSAALQKVGVDVLDANGNLRKMDDILQDMAKKWDTLGNAEQTALAQTVAGTRQYTYLVSLMENWDDMTRNIQTAADAEGTLAKQNDVYMESLQAHYNRLQAASEDLYDSLLDSDSFKVVIDAATFLVERLGNAVEAFDGLGGVMLAIGGIATRVFSAQIGRGIQSTVSTMQMLKQNTEDVKSALNLTQEFQRVIQSAENTEQPVEQLTKDIVDFSESLTKARVQGLVSEEEYNSLSQYSKQIETLSKEIDVLESKKREFENIAGTFNDSYDLFDNTETMEKFQKELDSAKKSLIDFTREGAKTSETYQKLHNILKNKDGSAGIDKIKEAAVQLEEKLIEVQETSESLGMTEVSEKAAQQLARVREIIEKLKTAEGAEAENLRRELNGILATTGQLSNETVANIDRIQKEVLELDGEISKATNNLKNFVQGLRDSLKSIDIAKMGQGISQIASGILSLASAINNIKTLISNVTDDTKSAGEKIESVVVGIASVLVSLPIALSGINTGINAVTAGLKGSALAAGGLAKALIFVQNNLGIIVVGIAAVAAAWKLIKWFSEKDERNLQAYTDNVKELAEASDSAAKKANELKDAVEEYDTLKSSLDSMIEGTEDWRDALGEVEDKVLEIINTYPEMAAAFERVNGQWVLNENESNKILEGIENRKNSLLLSTELMKNNLAEKEQSLENKKNDLPFNTDALDYINKNFNDIAFLSKDIYNKFQEASKIKDSELRKQEESAIMTSETYKELNKIANDYGYKYEHGTSDFAKNFVLNENEIKEYIDRNNEFFDRFTEKNIALVDASAAVLSRFDEYNQSDNKNAIENLFAKILQESQAGIDEVTKNNLSLLQQKAVEISGEGVLSEDNLKSKEYLVGYLESTAKIEDALAKVPDILKAIDTASEHNVLGLLENGNLLDLSAKEFENFKKTYKDFSDDFIGIISNDEIQNAIDNYTKASNDFVGKMLKFSMDVMGPLMSLDNFTEIGLSTKEKLLSTLNGLTEEYGKQASEDFIKYISEGVLKGGAAAVDTIAEAFKSDITGSKAQALTALYDSFSEDTANKFAQALQRSDGSMLSLVENLKKVGLTADFTDGAFQRFISTNVDAASKAIPAAIETINNNLSKFEVGKIISDDDLDIIRNGLYSAGIDVAEYVSESGEILKDLRSVSDDLFQALKYDIDSYNNKLLDFGNDYANTIRAEFNKSFKSSFMEGGTKGDLAQSYAKAVKDVLDSGSQETQKALSIYLEAIGKTRDEIKADAEFVERNKDEYDRIMESGVRSQSDAFTVKQYDSSLSNLQNVSSAGVKEVENNSALTLADAASSTSELITARNRAATEEEVKLINEKAEAMLKVDAAASKLDTTEIENYKKELLAIDKALGDDPLALNEEAKALAQADKGFKNLYKNFDDMKEALEGSGAEWSKYHGDVSDALLDIADKSDEWAKEGFGDMSTEAIQALKDSGALDGLFSGIPEEFDAAMQELQAIQMADYFSNKLQAADLIDPNFATDFESIKAQFYEQFSALASELANMDIGGQLSANALQSAEEIANAYIRATGDIEGALDVLADQGIDVQAEDMEITSQDVSEQTSWDSQEAPSYGNFEVPYITGGQHMTTTKDNKGYVWDMVSLPKMHTYTQQWQMPGMEMNPNTETNQTVSKTKTLPAIKLKRASKAGGGKVSYKSDHTNSGGNVGGGGSGSRGRRSGGSRSRTRAARHGTVSKSSSPKKDIYRGVDQQIKRYSNTASQLSNANKNLRGDELIKNIEKQTEALKKLNEETKKKLDLTKKDIKDRKELLKKDTKKQVTTQKYTDSYSTDDGTKNYEHTYKSSSLMKHKTSAVNKDGKLGTVYKVSEQTDGFGFKFNSRGEITNLDKIWDQYKSVYDYYDKLYNNLAKKTELTASEEAIMKIYDDNRKMAEANIKNLEDAAKELDDLAQQQLDLAQELYDNALQIIDNQVLSATIQIDVELERNSFIAQWNDFKHNTWKKISNLGLNIDVDKNAFTGAMENLGDASYINSVSIGKKLINDFKAAEALKVNSKGYVTEDSKKKAKNLVKKGNAFVTQDDNGKYIYDEAKSLETLQNFVSQGMDTIQEWGDQVQAIIDSINGEIAQVSEGIDNIAQAYQNTTDRLTTNQSILNKIFGENNAELNAQIHKQFVANYKATLKKESQLANGIISEVQAANRRKLYETIQENKKTRDEIQRKIDEAEANGQNASALKKELKKVKKQLKQDQEEYANTTTQMLSHVSNETAEAVINVEEQAINAMQATLEEALENSLAYFQNLLVIFINDLNKELFDNGFNMDAADTQWEALGKKAELFLDAVNGVYEIDKMIRDCEEEIENTTDKVVKAKLKEKQAELEILKAKAAQGELSQYELERAQAEFDLYKARIALEDARNSKTQMQLKRDANGNYSYVYTASSTKTDNAEQKVADAENKLYNLDKETYKDIIKQIEATNNEYQDKLNDLYQQRLAGNLSQEEYDTQVAELTKQYSEIIDDERQIYDTVKNNLGDGLKDIPESSSQLAKAADKLTGSGPGNFDDNASKLIAKSNESLEAYIEEMKGFLKDNYLQEYKEKTGKNISDISTLEDLQQAMMDVGLNTGMDRYTLETKANTKALVWLTGYVSGILEHLEEAKSMSSEYISSIDELREGIKELYIQVKKAAEQIEKAEFKDAATMAGQNLKSDMKDSGGYMSKDAANDYDATTGYRSKIIEKGKEKDSSYSWKNDSSEEATAIRKARAKAQKNVWEKGNTPKYTGKLYNDKHVTKENIKDEKVTLVRSAVITNKNGKTFDVVEVKYKDNTYYADAPNGTPPYAGWDWGYIPTTMSESDKNKRFLYKPKEFNTGGYTGDWTSEDGRWAILHKKELVLNEDDTANFLEAIKFMREIVSAANTNIGDYVKDLASKFNLINKTSDIKNINNAKEQLQQITQHITINPDFSGVNTVDQIERAFANMRNEAIQYLNR